MSILILILFLGAAFFLVGAGLQLLAKLITGDGSSERTPHTAAQPPPGPVRPALSRGVTRRSGVGFQE